MFQPTVLEVESSSGTGSGEPLLTASHRGGLHHGGAHRLKRDITITLSSVDSPEGGLESQGNS